MPLRKGNQTIDQYGNRYSAGVEPVTDQSISVPGPGGQPINVNVNVNVNLGDLIAQIIKGTKTAREAVNELLEARRAERKRLIEESTDE